MSLDLDRVGLIGIGQMGSAIAANLLQAGFAVIGYDPDEARLASFADRGGRPATSPADVANEASVVLTSLPSLGAFEDVLGGTTGIRSVARDGLVVVETSTLPLAAKEWGLRQFEATGVAFLDCPLSGTADQAARKDVVVFASGERGAIEAIAPVFDGFARGHHFVGGFGAGTKMKFVANLLIGIHNVAAAEALILGEKAGLDPEAVYEVIRDSAATSRMWEVRVPKMLRREFDTGVASRVFDKDVSAISDFAHALDCPVPIFSACAQIYAASLATGHAQDDTAAVHEVLKLMAGVAPRSA